MIAGKGEVAVPDEVIISKIYFIRGKKVMLDRDLAELYGEEIKQLKRAVRRNIERFPADFMFEMNKDELKNWRCQFGTSNKEQMQKKLAKLDNNIRLPVGKVNQTLQAEKPGRS